MASNLPSNCSHDEELDHIIKQFNNHPSILKIKEKHPCPSIFSLSNAGAAEGGQDWSDHLKRTSI